MVCYAFSLLKHQILKRIIAHFLCLPLFIISMILNTFELIHKSLIQAFVLKIHRETSAPLPHLALKREEHGHIKQRS